MSLPPTSLIIASLNRHDLLYDTVKSILDGDEVPNEIIVIDQSQEPHSLLSKMGPYRGCEIRYCSSKSVGTSAARNSGMKMSRFENLAIIDDDVFVARDWLTMLIGGMTSQGPNCVVSGKVLDTKRSDGGFAPSTKTDDEPAIYKGRVGKDVLWSNNMAMPRSVMEDVGFFDECLGPGTIFPASEDNDFGFRLLEAGYRISYLPSAIVYHRDWRPKKDYLRLRWKYGVGRGAFYAKYFDLRDRYSLKRMAQDIRDHILAVPGDFRQDRLKAYGDLVLIGGLVVGACRWLVHYGSNALAYRSRVK